MDAVLHADAAEFARLARPLLEPDPVRHTLVLTVLDSVCRAAFVPVAMLTVHDGGRVVGALLRTVDRPALVSGLPPRCAAVAADALLRHDLDPGGAQGPEPEAAAFAAAWSARTGAAVEVGLRLRLFALEELRPPAGVPGSARAVAADDEAGIDLLAAWRKAFDVELDGAWPHAHTPRHDVVRALVTGAGELLWEVDGVPVAQASARAVAAGMSRIGPVYTPPEHRCRGYAAAATTAAARWAQDRGARHVLLFTDLANPTTNRLYPRLGFRPRHDASELRFTPRARRG
jgi:GNAT superfamily N-acetyltransferase